MAEAAIPVGLTVAANWCWFASRMHRAALLGARADASGGMPRDMREPTGANDNACEIRRDNQQNAEEAVAPRWTAARCSREAAAMLGNRLAASEDDGG